MDTNSRNLFCKADWFRVTAFESVYIATQALNEAEVQKTRNEDSLKTPAEPHEDGQSHDTRSTEGVINTKTDEEISQQTFDKVLDEFTQTIAQTFETFCNDFELQRNKSGEPEEESVDNELSVVTSRDENSDDAPRCSLAELESLKEKIQITIIALLRDKGTVLTICLAPVRTCWTIVTAMGNVSKLITIHTG